MIRKAKTSDFEHVYKLIMMASKLVFEDALNTNEESKLKELAFKYFNDENTKFSYKNTYIYEKSGEIAGCLIYYDSDKELEYNNNMETYLDNEYRFSIEAVENTIYLDTIAVFEKYRGERVARQLIEFMIENEKRNISLIAESHKQYVIDYYKRIGFEVVKEENIYGSRTYFMLYKAPLS